MAGDFAAPLSVHLYEGTAPSEVNAHELAAFLQQEVPPLAIDLRADFVSYWLERSGQQQRGAPAIARTLAQARVQDPGKPVLDRDPLPGEVDFELRFFTAGGRKPAGILYDGHKLTAIYSELLVPDEVRAEHCHIALTNQLFGTWDENDRRYHARVSVYGFPSLVSTTGLVEGPAKPREFYLGRRMGADRANLEQALRGRYLEYGDPRLQEAVKGCLLQAVFYHVMGEPFCEDKECRLFNAHWQEELIHAQTRPEAGLCKRHRDMLESWACK